MCWRNSRKIKIKWYIKRDIIDKIKEAATKFASITIYGPRQVGKSTLIENVFPSFKYITLDDIEIRNYALSDPKGFLKYFSTPLVIDEIQKAPSLLEHIKKEIDEMKKKALLNNEPIKLLYILSGSNQFELQQAVTESLSGRTCVFNLSSFSYNEIKERGSHSFFNAEIDNLRKKKIC